MNFTDYNTVEQHIENYVNDPSAWNEACPEVRTRPDPKADKFASDEVDTWTMTLAPATTFDPKDGSDVNHWERLEERHEDRLPRESYDDRQQQQDDRYRWTLIQSMADDLDLTQRQRVAVHKIIGLLDLQKGGRPLSVLVLAASVWCLNHDVYNDNREWDSLFDDIMEMVSQIHIQYKKKSVIKAVKFIDDILTTEVDKLFIGEVPGNPSFGEHASTRETDINRDWVVRHTDGEIEYIPWKE